jgi:hypothetical protein
MDQFRAEIEPLLELVRHHMPPELLDHALIGAGIGGVCGLILAIWGLRIFRPVLVLCFVAGGACVGMAGNQWLQLGQWFCVVCGALVFGALGFVLYRLWVGVAWAALLVSIAMGVFGYRTAWPHWDAFSEERLSHSVLPETDFQPPTADEQAEANQPDPTVVFREFGGYLTEAVPNIQRDSVAIIGLAGVLGLLMGLLAARFTVIFGTALLGVSLVGGSAWYILSEYRPDTLLQATSRPGAMWAGVGIAVLTCMAIQYFQARTRPAAQQAAPAPAKG